MDWPHIAEVVSDALAVAVVYHLLRLRLHRVYKLFCIFLAYELIPSALAFWIYFAHPRGVEYRVVWLLFEPLGLVLSLAMVYIVVSALLATLPGVRKFARGLLNVTFLAAVILGAVTARPEFLSVAHRGLRDRIASLVVGATVADRVISSVALLILAAALLFILWFPVEMPRNLSVFSIGFLVYFGARTSLLIAYSFGAHVNFDLLNILVLLVFSACLLYWLIFINKAGEEAPARMGHSWNAVEQQRLIAQLEAMNATLLRAARR
jgi:hypothetical protein